MNCKDCEHFKIINEPFGYEWGQAKCTKYDISVDFKNNGQLKDLTCVDDRDFCAKCKYYHVLKHNFVIGKGFEKSHCCDVLLHSDGEGWVQEVEPSGMCEMFERRVK